MGKVPGPNAARRPRRRSGGPSAWCGFTPGCVEKGGDHGVAHERGEPLERPVLAEDEELEELGGAVGEHDVAGFVDGDVWPEGTLVVEVSGVDRHALQALG